MHAHLLASDSWNWTLHTEISSIFQFLMPLSSKHAKQLASWLSLSLSLSSLSLTHFLLEMSGVFSPEIKGKLGSSNVLASWRQIHNAQIFMLSENRRNYRKCPFVAAISTDLHNLSSLANTTTALISVEAACMSKPPYWIMGAGMLPNSNLYLSQGAALRGLPCWIIHGGIHFWQLPRQGVCKLSIGIPHGGGGVFLLCICDDNDGRWWWYHHCSDKLLSLAARHARLKNWK